MGIPGDLGFDPAPFSSKWCSMICPSALEHIFLKLGDPMFVVSLGSFLAFAFDLLFAFPLALAFALGRLAADPGPSVCILGKMQEYPTLVGLSVGSENLANSDIPRCPYIRKKNRSRFKLLYSVYIYIYIHLFTYVHNIYIYIIYWFMSKYIYISIERSMHLIVLNPSSSSSSS